MSGANVSTHPTVYAYLDLAVGNGVPSSWDKHDWLQFGTEELKTLRSGEVVEFDWASVMVVCGARALEVAEQEVGEAAASVASRLSRAVDLRDRLRAKLAETGTKFATLTKSDARERVGLGIDYASGPAKTVLVLTRDDFGLPYSVHVTLPLLTARARDLGICRICGIKPEYRLPFVYDFGREHAHEACLKQERMSVESVGREVPKALNQEVKPMLKVHRWNQSVTSVNGYKALIHVDHDRDEFAIYLVDDEHRPRRVLVLAGVSRVGDEMVPSWTWIDRREGGTTPATIRLPGKYRDAIKAALAEMCGMDYAVLPPLVIEGLSPQACEKIAEDFKLQQPGRSVVVLPSGTRVADAPPDPYASQPIASDISRRADIAAASHKSLRVGGILGLVAGLSLACIALGAVAKLKPEWLVPKRTPVVMDEHARESEDARAK